MDQVKVGVVGVGRMGQSHCRVYSSLRQAELVGVCDKDPEVGIAVAQRYQVGYYPCAEELLERVDAVSIATPTPTHFALALRCLETNTHVLVEKPLTETLDQAEALAQAAEAGSVVLQVGHIERFNPAYRELKAILQEMTVLAIDLRRLSAFDSSNTDVDVVLDLMIHDTDLALDLVGRNPDTVSGYGLTAVSGVLDHVIAHLAFDTGPLVTLTASRVTEQKIRSIEVTALDAYLETDLLNKAVAIHRRTVGEYLNYNKRGVKYRQEGIIQRIHVPIFEPLYLQLDHFLGCILDDKPPLVPARAGLNAMRLTDAIRGAIRQNLVDANMAQRLRPDPLSTLAVASSSA